jgi:hypothetical protein
MSPAGPVVTQQHPSGHIRTTTHLTTLAGAYGGQEVLLSLGGTLGLGH